MNVCIQLFGVFRIDRFKEEEQTFSSGTSACDVVEQLGLPQQLLGIVVINDLHAQLDDLLHDGDTLSLFPLLDGG